jgi:putative phosphoesterase
LISDTHIYQGSRRRIPSQVLDLFRRSGSSVIVHCGDVQTGEVLEELNLIGPVLTVCGNNDYGEFGRSLPMRIDLTVGERLIRVVHGHGGRSARAVATDFSPGCDVVIYGHSHIPMIERVGETILINPGSPSDRRWHPHFGVGFLTIADGVISPELVLFTDPADLDRITLPPIRGVA